VLVANVFSKVSFIKRHVHILVIWTFL